MNLLTTVLEPVNGVNFNLLDMLLICPRPCSCWVVCDLCGATEGVYFVWGHLLKLAIRFTSPRFVSEPLTCVGGEQPGIK